MAAGYFDLFDRLDEEIEKLEELIFARPGRRAVDATFALRRRLIGLRRILGPQRDIFSTLMRRVDLPWLGAANRLYLSDIFEQYMRLTDQLSTFHDLAGNLLEAYLSLASNRLNEIVKVLTVINRHDALKPYCRYLRDELPLYAGAYLALRLSFRPGVDGQPWQRHALLFLP